MKINDEWLKHFFSAVDENMILRRRESSSIEFKEIFDWSDKTFQSKISLAASSFANNRGGIIVFGVANKPHKIVGVNGYDDVDDAVISQTFSNLFSPEIQFERAVHKICGVEIGLLNIFESGHKPVICCKHSPKTSESDIYYRYGARSSKIKSGDLLILLQSVKDKESDKWLRLIQNVSKFGISNVGLFNTESGELTGQNNNFILDEDLVEQIKFVDRYSIEEDGNPALRIVGEVRESAKIIEKVKPIYDEDVYVAFLTGGRISSDIEYLKAVTRFNSEYYPIYCFMENSDGNSLNYYEQLKNIKTKTATRRSMLDRVENDEKLLNKSSSYPFAATTLGRKNNYFNNINSSIPIEVNDETDCKAFFQALFHLKKDDFDPIFLKETIYNIYKKFYPLKKML